MTTSRTDTHRPQVFDPAEYTEIGFFDNHPEDGGCWVDAGYANKTEFDGNYMGKGRCDHCGAGPLRYGVVFYHAPSDSTLVTGTICAAKLNLGSRSEIERKQLLEQAIRETKRAEWLALDSHHVAVLDFLTGAVSGDDGGSYGSSWSFLHDLLHKLNRYGSLSEKQVAAVDKFIARRDEFAARKAEENAEITADFPAGRVTVTGEIVSTKYQDSMYGSTLKMLVKLDDGNKVWGTVPSSLDDSRYDGETGECEDLKGTRITFTATFTVSDDDEHFGFFKIPKKVEILNADEIKQARTDERDAAAAAKKEEIRNELLPAAQQILTDAQAKLAEYTEADTSMLTGRAAEIIEEATQALRDEVAKAQATVDALVAA